jgi:hypothetical protein
MLAFEPAVTLSPFAIRPSETLIYIIRGFYVGKSDIFLAVTSCSLEGGHLTFQKNIVVQFKGT